MPNNNENKLTHKQQVFIDEYLKSFNASEAAKLAGYSAKTAHAMGWENLRKPEIKTAIEARLDEVHMGADEAIKLHSEIARGDIGDLLDDNGLLDIRLARKLGKTRLLRKIKQKTITRIGKKENDDDVEITEIEFEMYPADAAQERILKLLGKFIDRHEHTGKDGTPIEYIVKVDDDTDNNQQEDI